MHPKFPFHLRQIIELETSRRVKETLDEQIYLQENLVEISKATA